MAERRRRPRHRPRLAPPRAGGPPPSRGVAAEFDAFRRRLRGPLDRIARAIERPAPLTAETALLIRAAAWRAGFWLWLLLLFATDAAAAAAALFATLGMALAGVAAFADIADLRRLSVAGLLTPNGDPAPAELRWIAAAVCGLHGVVAGAAALISAVPALIGLFGGYAW